MTAGEAFLFVLGFLSGWYLARGWRKRRLARRRAVLADPQERLSDGDAGS